MSKTSASEILKAAFKRKRATRRGYSANAFARDLGVTPTFVSNMLNGKKLPPRERINDISKILELDSTEKRSLIQSILLQKEASPLIRKYLRDQVPPSARSLRVPVSPNTYNIFTRWWIIPILESLTLESPLNNGSSIIHRLGISSKDYEIGIKFLLNEGLIEKTNNGYVKKNSHLYFATGRSKRDIRQFHEQMIQKAREALTKVQEEDFQQRLITGFTFAMAPEHLEALKIRITQFLGEVSQEASDGQCDSIYQLNVQLFPLTSK